MSQTQYKRSTCSENARSILYSTRCILNDSFDNINIEVWFTFHKFSKVKILTKIKRSVKMWLYLTTLCCVVKVMIPQHFMTFIRIVLQKGTIATHFSSCCCVVLLGHSLLPVFSTAQYASAAGCEGQQTLLRVCIYSIRTLSWRTACLFSAFT